MKVNSKLLLFADDTSVLTIPTTYKSANKHNINTKSDEQVVYSKWIIPKYRQNKCNAHQMKSSSRQPISNLLSKCGN